VVDGLRPTEDFESILGQAVGRGQRAFAAYRDDAVDLVAVQRLGDVVGAAPLSLVGIGAAGAEDRAPDLREPLDLVTGERHEIALDHSAPSVADADEFQVVRRGALEHDSADDRVESGAVAAAGEDADLHADAFTFREGDLATLPALDTSGHPGRTPSRRAALTPPEPRA